MMALLNYTTTISIDKTVAEIMGMLARSGATQIGVLYDGQGTPTGIGFAIPTEFGPRGFRWNVDVLRILEVMKRQHRDGQVRKGLVTIEQAARVGWRIERDWLAAQLAKIQVEAATLTQVMLPYMTVDNGGTTLYEHLLETRLALPEAEE